MAITAVTPRRYVFSERALDVSVVAGERAAPSPAELCTIVGLINLPLAAAYVAFFTARGNCRDKSDCRFRKTATE